MTAHKAQVVYLNLQPSESSQENIEKFETLLKKSEANPGEAAARL